MSLSSARSVHVLRTDFCKIHFNIIFPSTPTSPKWHLSFLSNPPLSSTCSTDLIPTKTRCKLATFSSGLQYSQERQQQTAFVNTLRETEYQSCIPKFHRLVYTALPVLGMPRLSVTQVNPLAERMSLSRRTLLASVVASSCVTIQLLTPYSMQQSPS